MSKSKKEDNPEVHIFGEKFTEEPKCKFFPDSGGLILLTAGIILILNNMNIIPWDFWNHIWIFWPVFLILAGIKIILGRNILSNLVSFVITLFLIAFVATYALMEIKSPLLSNIPAEFIVFVKTYTGGIK